jgi:hypothetical protein
MDGLVELIDFEESIVLGCEATQSLPYLEEFGHSLVWAEAKD